MVPHVAVPDRARGGSVKLSWSPGPSVEPGGLGPVDDKDVRRSQEVERQVMASAASRRELVITWEAVRAAGVSDKVYAGLLFARGSGGQDELWDELTEYRRYRDELMTVDGVVLFRGQIVVPRVLRKDVLAGLHRAHQGTTGMSLQGQDSVWWPGFTTDLARVREGCLVCVKNAPSQPALLPVQSPMPDYPFQLISADYLVMGAKTTLS